MNRLIAIAMFLVCVYFASEWIGERLRVAAERKEQCAAVYERGARCLIVRASSAGG